MIDVIQVVVPYVIGGLAVMGIVYLSPLILGVLTAAGVIHATYTAIKPC